MSLLFLFAPSFVHECFLFPSFVPDFSLPVVSSLVHCLFPLGPFRFRASSFVSGLFRWALLRLSCPLLLSGLFHHWAFPFLARSRFLVPPHLVFSPLDVVGTFFYALRQAFLFLVSRHCPSGSCPSCSVPCHFFCYAVISLTCIPGFSWLPVSSFTPLPRSLRSLLGAFVGVIPGLLCCGLSVLGAFLLLVLMLFSRSSFSLAGLFCGDS